MKAKLAVGVVVVCLILGLGYVLSSGPFSPGEAEASARVPAEMLPALIMGEDDLPPLPVILASFDTGSKATFIRWKDLAKPDVIEATWLGPPSGTPGTKGTGRYSISIGVVVAEAAEEAERAAEHEVGSHAVMIPEITEDSFFQVFADRAWCHADEWGGRIIFTRGNVIGDVHIHHGGGCGKEVLTSLAARLGDRIQAAMEGRPYPIPYLPPSADDMKVDLEGAWKLKNAGEIAGSSPAGQEDSQAKDCMVTLNDIAEMLGTKTKPQIGEGEASLGIRGKEFALKEGTTQVHLGDKAMRLSRPPIFVAGQVLIPMLFAKDNLLPSQ